MKILVTGSSGFIGKSLVKILREHKIVPYDLKKGLDILDVDKLERKMRGCDVVVHLAAFASVEDSWKNPTLYYMNNVIGTANVLEAAIKCGVKKIVFSSSSAVYEPNSSPYATSKVMCEQMFKTRSRDIQSVCLRLFNVYGVGQNPEYGRVIDTFIDRVKAKKDITIFGDGNQTRDFVHILDACRAIKLVIETDIPDRCLIADVGFGFSYSINYLADSIQHMVGQFVSVRRAPARREMRDTLADIRCMENIFGFVPEVDIISGMEELI